MGIFRFYLFNILNRHLERNFFHPVPSNIGNSTSKLSILSIFFNFSKFLNLFYPVPSNIGNSSSQFSNCAWGVDFPLTLCSRGICLILCTLQRTFEHLSREEHLFFTKNEYFSHRERMERLLGPVFAAVHRRKMFCKIYGSLQEEEEGLG